VPQVIHTDPAIARVGLDEAAARAKAGTIRVLRWPLAETDRAQADRETGGHVKLITDRRGRILGAAIVGARAGELILPFVLAVERGLSVRHFAGLPAPYPSAGEAGARAALAFYVPYLTAAWVRRIIGLLRRLG
jgi:pyruvate/2-oxoglutarate dehydrogenase complex dihydrolipoamide dehydrogenase (E3) component